MQICKEKDEKLIIISIPLTSLFLIFGGIILQIIVISIFYGAFQDGSFKEFLGYSWLEKGLKLFLLGLPLFFALLSYLLIPLVKTEINRRQRFIAIKKVIPFSWAKRFGFDYIKNKVCIYDKNSEELQNRGVYFELNSGERVNLFNDASATEKQNSKLVERINTFIRS